MRSEVVTHMRNSGRLLLGAAVAAVLLAGLLGCGPSDEQSGNAALCANGVAVPDPDNNPRWVSDCAVLLSVRDTLAGDAVLNWNADTSVEEWAGLAWTDEGVWVLLLAGQGLTGEVPAELGQLPALEKLGLFENRLSHFGAPASGVACHDSSVALECLDVDVVDVVRVGDAQCPALLSRLRLLSGRRSLPGNCLKRDSMSRNTRSFPPSRANCGLP